MLLKIMFFIISAGAYCFTNFSITVSLPPVTISLAKYCPEVIEEIFNSKLLFPSLSIRFLVTTTLPAISLINKIAFSAFGAITEIVMQSFTGLG